MFNDLQLRDFPRTLSMIRGRLANVFLETVASSLLGDTMLVIKINVSTPI